METIKLIYKKTKPPEPQFRSVKMRELASGMVVQNSKDLVNVILETKIISDYNGDSKLISVFYINQYEGVKIIEGSPDSDFSSSGRIIGNAELVLELFIDEK